MIRMCRGHFGTLIARAESNRKKILLQIDMDRQSPIKINDKSLRLTRTSRIRHIPFARKGRAKIHKMDCCRLDRKAYVIDFSNSLSFVSANHLFHAVRMIAHLKMISRSSIRMASGFMGNAPSFDWKIQFAYVFVFIFETKSNFIEPSTDPTSAFLFTKTFSFGENSISNLYASSRP